MAVLTFAAMAVGSWAVLLGKRWYPLPVIVGLVLGAVVLISDITFGMGLGVQW